MNQRNVDALVEILFDIKEEHGELGHPRDLAEEIVARGGVIVPAALTASNTWDMLRTEDNYPLDGFCYTTEEIREITVKRLEEIARGDT